MPTLTKNDFAGLPSLLPLRTHQCSVWNDILLSLAEFGFRPGFRCWFQPVNVKRLQSLHFPNFPIFARPSNSTLPHFSFSYIDLHLLHPYILHLSQHVKDFWKDSNFFWQCPLLETKKSILFLFSKRSVPDLCYEHLQHPTQNLLTPDPILKIESPRRWNQRYDKQQAARTETSQTAHTAKVVTFKTVATFTGTSTVKSSSAVYPFWWHCHHHHCDYHPHLYLCGHFHSSGKSSVGFLRPRSPSLPNPTLHLIIIIMINASKLRKK